MFKASETHATSTDKHYQQWWLCNGVYTTSEACLTGGQMFE